MQSFDEFEKFRGKRMYYVTDYTGKPADRTEAIREISRQTKTKREQYVIVTVWIQRDVDGWDLLWLKEVPESERMMAVVRT